MRFTTLVLHCGFAAAFPLAEYNYTAPRSVGLPPNAQHLTRVQRSNSQVWTNKRQAASLYNFDHNTLFLTEISIEGQNLWVEIDTGSSELWVVYPEYECVADYACNVAETYEPGDDFTVVPNENCYPTYSDGTFVKGIVGTAPVVVAGIVVPSQVVCVAQQVSYYADMQISGLMGLSYNAGTADFSGTDPSADTASNRVISSSIMDTILAVDELTEPYFAIALSRDQSNTGYGGVFTIGELPDLSDPRINAPDSFTSQPINPGTSEYNAYEINADIAYGTTQDVSLSISGTVAYVVDTGTTLLDVPEADAVAFNTLWDPPYLSKTNGQYKIDCDAKPPILVVLIGGSDFLVNPLDLILVEGDGSCVSGVGDAPDGYAGVLGEVFLRNVLAVFDWGTQSIHFAAREIYES